MLNLQVYHLQPISYFGPVHPSSSNSGGSVSEASNFANHWNGQSMPNELSPSYAFLAFDLHCHGWEHHSSPPPASGRNISIDLPSIPSVTKGLEGGILMFSSSRSVLQPFLPGHRQQCMGASTSSTGLLPTNATWQFKQRENAHDIYYRRSSSQIGSAQVLPTFSFSDHTSGFFYIPSDTFGWTFREQEIAVPYGLHAWEWGQWSGLSGNQWEGKSKFVSISPDWRA